MTGIGEDSSLLEDEEKTAFVLFSETVDNHLSMFESVVADSKCVQQNDLICIITCRVALRC